MTKASKNFPLSFRSLSRLYRKHKLRPNPFHFFPNRFNPNRTACAIGIVSVELLGLETAENILWPEDKKWGDKPALLTALREKGVDTERLEKMELGMISNENGQYGRWGDVGYRLKMEKF